ncbi:AAA family ATPase [Porticoccus litoralis]|jgi:MoxR-like ATPase|uniref:MoxR family ATPase n=1 Tax=Porticoccus litoralis TaxID=434086 RepID=A0AAW8AVW0_9GAMM|nr:MoxR family ATPase [Porticoccus litoralis]MDP1519390.1 MoxR family ATPase [Porticoccus litoralis]TNE84494.1 MAG: MoxR family ATPase [Gammaproteobacteria bacterium]
MQKVVDRLVADIGTVLIGKEEQIRLALACLFARGHLLIEDLPGMGKTTLAQALARVLGLSYNRIQFTSDLLPADILGVSVYDRERSLFEFHPGPVFNQLLLADEINRTTPKTQSALLEAMAEGQVTVEGETRPLPTPFFVIATQNPVSQSGTYPLPESQLDRFLMRIELGYPDPASERLLLSGTDPRLRLVDMKPLLNPDQLLKIQQQVNLVKASESLVDYLQRLAQYTRDEAVFQSGLSPRGTLATLQCARAWALIQARQYVIPEDVQAVFPTVAGHRLRGAGEFSGHDSGLLVQRVLNAVDIL